MPPKFNIHTSPIPNRFQTITKSGVIAWEEGCLKCARCVKKECVYKVYEKRHLDTRQMLDTLDSECQDCFRCVQNCPNGLIQKGLNPAYKVLGDHYWTPEIISSLWFQAETGRIPVSGGGYGGPFSGPGFDAMWTDMSEIVRPTRDGIHGREYISTNVDLGRKLMFLEFGPDGSIVSPAPPLEEIPLPVIFDILPWSPPREKINLSFLECAQSLGTFTVVRQSDLTPDLEKYLPHIVVLVDGKPENLHPELIKRLRMIELLDSENVMAVQAVLKEENPRLVVIVKMPLNSKASERALQLIRQGAGVLHLYADEYGLEEADQPLFIKERMKEIHLRLVEGGVRDQITLIASGGIAMAEHMAKLIICGADAITIDIPLLAAMECRVCRRCKEGIACPVEIDRVDPAWGSARIRNLMAGWHNQLLEIMGAMGIREVRRLRGETGRAMFFEDLEKEIFAEIGNVKSCMKPKTSEVQKFNFPVIKEVPSRFRNALGRYRIAINKSCNNCGLCIELCPYGVYTKGAKRPKAPCDHLCTGFTCSTNEFYCVSRCPEKAITVTINPAFEILGDRRWTGDLLASTWHMAETGEIPHQGLNYKTGDSGGGFDKLRFIFPKENRLSASDNNVIAGPKGAAISEESVSTAIELNRSDDSRPKITIPVPFYLGGMSFGSVSITTMLSRVRAAVALGTFCCTGEGGYPEELMDYDDHIITQVATGLFGIREETIKRVRIVEFKYAQGAKPGLGGHLLGDKVTPRVAQMREAVQGSALFSPFPFHSVYSVEDHKKHVDWIKETNPRALVSVKVSTPTDVDMVTVGSYYAGAHIVQLDGSYGGTGAAPDIAKKNIAMPIEYALPKVHKFLLAEGIRDRITIIASGGIRTAYDMAKAIAMGADGVCLGTADLVALECIRCHHCESGRGCARGIATTDEELTGLMELEWGTRRIINMYMAWRHQLIAILKKFGMKSVTELVGRFDVLAHLDYIKQEEIEGELERF